MNKKEVESYIWEIDSPEEIQELWGILKARHGQIRERLVHLFRKGDRVSFYKDNGEKAYGIVDKVNRKTVSVLVGEHEMWRVSPSLLTMKSDDRAVGEL